MLFLLARKWLRVGLEVGAKKILPSYLMIKTVRTPKSRRNNIAYFFSVTSRRKTSEILELRWSFTKVSRRGEKKGID